MRRPALTLTALAVTMAAIAIQSTAASDWPRTTRLVSAANIGWAARYPEVELQLIRTNSATGGLAEGLCDIAVLHTAVDGNRFATAVVGQTRRSGTMA